MATLVPSFRSSPLLRSTWNRSKRAQTGHERSVTRETPTLLVSNSTPVPRRPGITQFTWAAKPRIARQFHSSPLVHPRCIDRRCGRCDCASTRGEDRQPADLRTSPISDCTLLTFNPGATEFYAPGLLEAVRRINDAPHLRPEGGLHDNQIAFKSLDACDARDGRWLLIRVSRTWHGSVELQTLLRPHAF